MKALELNGKIKVEFAHVYKAETYKNGVHIGANEIEVCYLTEGKLEFTDGERVFYAEKGDITCFHNRSLQVKAQGFHCHHTVRFSVEEITSAEGGIFLPSTVKASPKTAEIEKWIDALIYKPYLFAASPTKTANIALSILCKIDEIYRAEGGERFKEGELLAQRAKKYVHKNLDSALTQREVARYLGVSPGYLCGQFKKAEGITLMAYVNRTKLAGVKNLMEKEGLKLKEASLRFGYSDPNYVSHLYKKTFGVNVTSKSDLPKLTKEE